MRQNCSLLGLLCSLLGNQNLRLSAARCLKAVVERNDLTKLNREKELALLLFFLSEKCLSPILQAIPACGQEKDYSQRDVGSLSSLQLCTVIVSLGARMSKVAKLYDKKDQLPATLTESDAFNRYLQAFRTLPLKWHQGLCQEGPSSSSQASRLPTDQPATDLYIFWAEQWKGIFIDVRFWTQSAISVIPLWLKDAFEHLICAVEDKDIFSPTDQERKDSVLKFRRLILEACRLAAGIDPQAACNFANQSLDAVLKSGADRQTPMVAEWKALFDLFVSFNGICLLPLRQCSFNKLRYLRYLVLEKMLESDIGQVKLLELCIEAVRKEGNPIVLKEQFNCISALIPYAQKVLIDPFYS